MIAFTERGKAGAIVAATNIASQHRRYISEINVSQA